MQETVKKVLNGDFNRKKALLFLITALLTVIVWNLPIDSFGIEGLTIVQQRVIAIFVMAVMLWLTEAIPAWATSVVIIFVLLFFVSDSAFKIMQGSEAEMGKLLDYQGVMACFADPTIILFLGGFVLAIAATKSGLDVMMAKALIAPFGKRSENVLLGFMLITGIFSMFISNTATAAMMLTFLTPVFKSLPPSGKGRVCDITYASLRRCVLKTGHGVKTTHRMPTLREALEVCKDRIVVNVDQGYEYNDLVLAVTEELGVTDQILIKGKRSTDAVAAKFAEHPRNMMYMPIIDILKPQGRALFAEYQEKGIAPLAYEVCWNKYTPEVKECMDKVVAGGSKLWVNSLWASLCGGLDDDAAFGGDPAEVYGKLVDMGATMIQTDRPELLISYLRSRGLHN